MRLLCCAYPRCRKVSRGNSEQASRCSYRRGTGHFLAVLLAGWWLSTTLTGIEAWRLPNPMSVISKGSVILALPSTWHKVQVTGAEAVAGCLLGSVVALPSAYVIYRSRILAAAVEPFLGATQALPAIAIAPNFLCCGSATDFMSIVVLCALMVFLSDSCLDGRRLAPY